MAANSNRENKADSEDESDSDSSVTVLPYEQWYVFIGANSKGLRDDLKAMRVASRGWAFCEEDFQKI